MTNTATLERGAPALPEAPTQARPNWWALSWSS